MALKNTLRTLIFLILLPACSSDDSLSHTEKNVLGTWELVAVYYTPGSSTEWKAVEKGYQYSFLNNGTFNSNRFDQCTTGKYWITDDELILDFGCIEFYTGIEAPAGTFIEEISFDGEYIILTPTYISCFAGCAYKFKRMY